jgi:hypothetical protein
VSSQEEYRVVRTTLLSATPEMRSRKFRKVGSKHFNPEGEGSMFL